MAKLADLGFSTDIISETIVSTYNSDGTSNAAPMGVIMKDSNHVIMNIFDSSLTYQNLSIKKQGVINITNDIEVFYKTAFKETNINGKLPQEWFECSQIVDAPEIIFSDATVAFSVLSTKSIGEKIQTLCRVEQITARETYPKVVCRAMSLTLEAIIHATRVKFFINNQNERKETDYLTDLIHVYSDVVNRVAPNSVYSLIMTDLISRIDSWRIKP